MKTDLLELSESQNADPEYVPTILPVDARLAVRGPVATFLDLFSRVASVIPTKEVISGTSHALLEVIAAAPNSLPYVRVSATDGSVAVSMVSDGIEPMMVGAALVPGKKIFEILKLAPTDTIRIEVLGTTVTLRSGRAQWEVQTVPGEALPPVADVSGVSTHTIPVEGFLEALTVARKAASTSPARASLQQVCVRSGSLTGMDGGRLHRMTVDGLPTEVDLTLPLRVVDEVTRLLKATSSPVLEFGGNSSHLVFRIDQDEIIAQRALVPFPDVESQVLAPALLNTYVLTVNRERLLDAIRRVRINSDPDYPAIFLTLVPGKTTDAGTAFTMTVSARDRSGNSSTEAMDVLWTGPAAGRVLCVVHSYLTDLLTTMDGEHAVLRVGEDTKTTRQPLFVENKVTGFTGWVSQVRPGYLS